MYSFTTSVVTYFTIFAVLGTNIFAQREIAYFRNNKQERSRVFWEILLLRGITSTSMLVLYYIFLFRISENRFIYLLQSIVILSVAFDISWFFQGMEEFKRLIFINLLSKVCYILLVFLLVKEESQLGLYIFITLFLNLISYALCWMYLPCYIERVSIKDIKIFGNFKEIISLFIPMIAIQIYTTLDKTMLGMFSDNTIENGYYEQAEKIVKVALTLVTSLGTVMFPRIAHTFSQGNETQIKVYMYKSYQFVWFLSIPMMFGLIVAAPVFVPWLLGEEFSECVSLIRAFSGLLIAIGISNVTGLQYLMPTKQQKVFTVSVTIGAIINIFLNFLLIPRFYSIGAIFASVIAEFAIAISQLIYVVNIKKAFEYIGVFKAMYKYLMSGCLMGGIIYYIVLPHVSNDIMGTVVVAGTGVSIYIITLFLWKDEMVIEVITKLRVSFFKIK